MNFRDCEYVHPVDVVSFTSLAWTRSDWERNPWHVEPTIFGNPSITVWMLVGTYEWLVGMCLPSYTARLMHEEALTKRRDLAYRAAVEAVYTLGGTPRAREFFEATLKSTVTDGPPPIDESQRRVLARLTGIIE